MKRTTVLVTDEWKQGVEKARELGLSMSKVVQVLICAWVKGEIDVKVAVETNYGVVDGSDGVDIPAVAAGDDENSTLSVKADESGVVMEAKRESV